MMATLFRLLPLLHQALAVGKGNPTLHCVVLATPNTYEVHMLAGQFRLKAGIFECDSYDIYSNVTAWELFKDHVDVADQLAHKVHNIGIPLFAPMVAGPPGWDPSDAKQTGKKGAKHLANTPIFETLWSQVCADGDFRHYSFTAKVDVDTVLLPERVSSDMHGRQPRAEYFWNVRNDMYGNFLHGPIELISRDAMKTLCKRSQVCKKSISQAAYGEDFYMNECLKHLGVPAVQGFHLLYDMYTYGDWGQKKCTPLVADKMVSRVPRTYASYHPRKDLESWIQCRREANSGKVLTHQEVTEALRESKLRSSEEALARASMLGGAARREFHVSSRDYGYEHRRVDDFAEAVEVTSTRIGTTLASTRPVTIGVLLMGGTTMALFFLLRSHVFCRQEAQETQVPLPNGEVPDVDRHEVPLTYRSDAERVPLV